MTKKRSSKNEVNFKKRNLQQSFFEKKKRKFHFEINSETKRGILAIFCFVLFIVTILSFLNLAGKAGQFVSQILKTLFGWTSLIPPFILILFIWFLFQSEKYPLKFSRLLGLVLSILSLAALSQWVYSQKTGIYQITLGQGGGYLGFFLYRPLKQIMDPWASLVVLLAFFLVSLLLIFETSLEKIIPFLFWSRKSESEKKSEAIQRPKYFTQFWCKYRIGLINILKYPFKVLNSLFKKTEAEEKISFTKTEIDREETKFEEESEKILKPTKPLEQLKIFSQTEIHQRKINLPLELLSEKSSLPTSGDIRANKMIIQKTLENFNIPCEMGEVQVGPTVTQYTLKPTEGIRLSQIVSLNNDLALALASHPIRIEAPIPGKSLVGIEVPNQEVALIRLKEILASSEFKKKKSNLIIALGKDVAGIPWVADLEEMPHLLLAGATGSGKTVMLNSIIVSFLYQNSPSELKFILIDPKRVELTIYDGIPYLLTPVLVEINKTINALRWIVSEMERRFEILSESGQRNIQSYNQRTEKKLPFIVVIIDELADLMTAAPREIETCIIRLAQMARATGIHLVMATQRPSVDVITGLIKANITSRIAFSVASIMDSRTILDFAGAEKLLGKGDMLFISPRLSRPKRLQGAFVSDQEIKNIVNYLKEKSKPEYEEEILKSVITSSGSDFGDLKEDELLPEAKEIILKYKKASASLLQRRLRIGYARAARLLDLLEEEGIIGPAEGAKPREILIEDLEEKTQEEFDFDNNQTE